MIKPSLPINEPLRKDRARDDAWIRELLNKLPFGTLATVQGDQPFIKPTLFAYDEGRHAIYIHGALVGRMRTNIEANPKVSFCVAEMGHLLPADTAMEFGVDYASVVVYGKAVVLEDVEEARYGLQLLLDRYFPHLKPGVDYQEIIKEEIDATTVYRIDVESWSGKATKERGDYPGAFVFPHE